MLLNPVHRVLVWAALSISLSVSLTACGRIGDGSGVDTMTNRPWAEIDMESREYNLRLWVQCDDGKSKIGLRADKFLTKDDGLSVLTKFGHDPNPSDETWPSTTTSKGAIRDGDPASFLKRLIVAREVRIRLTPVDSDVVDATFDTSDLANRLSKYGDRCGWGDLVKDAKADQQSESRPIATNWNSSIASWRA